MQRGTDAGAGDQQGPSPPPFFLGYRQPWRVMVAFSRVAVLEHPLQFKAVRCNRRFPLLRANGFYT